MKKFFKVYWPFSLNVIKSAFAYQGRFYLFMLGGLFTAFISYFLWVAIYNNSSSSVLGGFNKYEMIVYVFMSYIAANVSTISVSWDVAHDVMEGTIAMNLIKPIEYRWRLIAQAFGEMVYRLVLPSVFIWIGLEIYKFKTLGIPFTPISNILLFLLSVFMSFLLFVLFDFCFGMIAFFTTYFWGANIIKSCVLNFFTGALIPLSFFPDVFQKIFGYLPFASMNYVPVMIYLGKYSRNEIIFALLKQVAWVAILYILGSIIWRKVTKRLIVLGG